MVKVIGVALVVVAVLFFALRFGKKPAVQPPAPVASVKKTTKPTTTKSVAKAPQRKIAPTEWFFIETVEDFEELQRADRATALAPQRGTLPEKSIRYDDRVVTSRVLYEIPKPPAEVKAAEPKRAPEAPTNKLSVQEQQAVYYELSELEVKAAEEGLEQDPSYGETYQTYVQKRTLWLREATREKYGINQSQLEEIYRKGVNANWPVHQI